MITISILDWPFFSILTLHNFLYFSITRPNIWRCIFQSRDLFFFNYKNQVVVHDNRYWFGTSPHVAHALYHISFLLTCIIAVNVLNGNFKIWIIGVFLLLIFLLLVRCILLTVWLQKTKHLMNYMGKAYSAIIYQVSKYALCGSVLDYHLFAVVYCGLCYCNSNWNNWSSGV